MIKLNTIYEDRITYARWTPSPVFPGGPLFDRVGSSSGRVTTMARKKSPPDFATNGTMSDEPDDVETTSVMQTLVKTEELVEELRDGPMYKPALADAIGVSKSTVYNWTRELIDEDLVEKTAAGYRLTGTGRAQMELFEQWQTASLRAQLLETALEAIPSDYPPPERLFWNADLITSKKAHLTCFVDWLHDAESTLGLVPTVMLDEVTAYHGAIAEDSAVEFVVKPDLLAMLSDATRDVADPSEKNVDVTLYRSGDDFGFALIIRERPDPSLALILYRDDELVDVMLTSEDDRAVKWAYSVYERYRDDAVLVTEFPRTERDG